MTITRSWTNTLPSALTAIATETCCNCGVLFGMDQRFQAARREDHRDFYCPNGHSLAYNGKTEAEKLAEKVARLESTLTHTRDQATASERSARAYKGQATRIKNRIANGVCPCCNRAFANVARHMAGQHPDFTGSPS